MPRALIAGGSLGGLCAGLALRGTGCDVPGEGAATAPGRRRLNWVWYVTAAGDELARLLTDREGRRRHASLPPGAAPDAAVQALAERARREVHPMLAALVAATPAPFLQTIVDLVVPRTVFGRVCLLGDAVIVRPHTAGATAKAAHDARLLAADLADAGDDIDAARAASRSARSPTDASTRATAWHSAPVGRPAGQAEPAESQAAPGPRPCR